MRGDQPMGDAVAYHAGCKPRKLACIELATGRRWTYAEYHAHIERCAAWLQTRLENPEGERVAVLGRNSADLLALQLACVRIGAIFQPLNWRLTAAEIAFLVQDAQPRLVVFEAEFAGLLDQISPDVCDKVGFERFQIELAQAPARPFAARPLAADTPATLLYTSGTTGRPKGVIVTESNAFHTAVNFSLAAEVTPDAVFLCEMPMFHVAGLYATARTTLFQGATLVIAPRFDACETLARLSDPDLGVTHYFCVPQMAQVLREQPGFDPKALKRLKALCTGGAPNPPASIQRWLDDGVAMIEGFGMTEAGTVLCMPLGDLDRIRSKLGATGLPALNAQVRLVDPEGQDVADGEVGEIWLRGPNITPGYWGQPELTAKAFTDGWLCTGDAARRDAEGFIYLVDRWKDMFISGGENVFPAEVEAAILELDLVSEAAVVGTPDERWGEVGVAYVAAAPGAAVTVDLILTHCRRRIAGYKTPKRVVVVDALPRTASGKVRKDLLRQCGRPDIGEGGGP